MNTDMLSTLNALIKTIPLFDGYPSEKEYEEALELSEFLFDNDPHSPILTMLIAKIEEYENSLPEMADFNERIANTPAGVAMLRVIMDQYDLNQSDFEN
ncbi:transcriptional regulator [Rosenbergiella collisarenosi]|uniref:transcriptional regulator n=1 Tax=Rosenbergiella collisarenosi TaxID=1544695 RepID=UPI001FD42D5A|nr:transcriptional regulator [Rosenbergiella collisarenosi]